MEFIFSIINKPHGKARLKGPGDDGMDSFSLGIIAVDDFFI